MLCSAALIRVAFIYLCKSIMSEPPSKKQRFGEENGRAAAKEGKPGSGTDRQPNQDHLPQLYLPAPVWGGVLDYMPYSEVRSALLVGKLIAVDAARHVQTLNIFNVSEIDLPAARRFANVSEVNILCLRQGNGEGEYTFSQDTATRVIPFLSIFPKLKMVFVGGFHHNGFKVRYNDYDFVAGPDNHRTLFRSLVDNFCGAFKARAISKNISLGKTFDNMVSVGDCRWRGEDPRDHCAWCTNVCATFPPKEILWIPFCLKDVDRYSIFSNRPGGKEYLRKLQIESPGILIELLRINEHEVPNTTKEEKDFWDKMMREKHVDEDAHVQYITDKSFAELDKLIECGLDPSVISKGYFYSYLAIGIGEYDMWEKSTVDRLVSRGFALDANDLVVVDEMTEPVLRGLGRKIHCDQDHN